MESIKEYIVPNLTEKQKSFVYASEADIINVALFGMTAKEWREWNSQILKIFYIELSSYFNPTPAYNVKKRLQGFSHEKIYRRKSYGSSHIYH